MQKTILYLSHGGQKYHDQTRYKRKVSALACKTGRRAATVESED